MEEEEPVYKKEEKHDFKKKLTFSDVPVAEEAIENDEVIRVNSWAKEYCFFLWFSIFLFFYMFKLIFKLLSKNQGLQTKKNSKSSSDVVELSLTKLIRVLIKKVH